MTIFPRSPACYSLMAGLLYHGRTGNVNGFSTLASGRRRDYNDHMMAKSEKAFRRAALLHSKTAWLFCHILMAMSIGRMILKIIRCQTWRLAAKSIEFSIDFAIR